MWRLREVERDRGDLAGARDAKTECGEEPDVCLTMTGDRRTFLADVTTTTYLRPRSQPVRNTGWDLDRQHAQRSPPRRARRGLLMCQA